MKLVLQRQPSTAHSTSGILSVDGVFECYTLEEVVRPRKLPGITAIPAGAYPVVLTTSVRFGRVMPLLQNVPGFSGVRIHTGNTASDTEGCILVGASEGVNFLGTSRPAFYRLFPKLRAATTPILLTVLDAK